MCNNECNICYNEIVGIKPKKGCDCQINICYDCNKKIVECPMCRKNIVTSEMIHLYDNVFMLRVIKKNKPYDIVKIQSVRI